MPLQCLIVEDEALIASSLEAYFEESGFQVAGPFAAASQALAWLEHHTPDLALVDIMLKDGPCLGLAQELKARQVPFAVYSGLSRARDVPGELADAPWLEKPVRREELASLLVALTCPLTARLHDEGAPRPAGAPDPRSSSRLRG